MIDYFYLIPIAIGLGLTALAAFTEPPDHDRCDDISAGIARGCRHARRPLDARPQDESGADRCVARGYLSGSGWKDYRATGTVCGVPLPPGLRESDRLPAPIFTPATKATSGHDVNISEAEAGALVGDPLVATLRELTLALYAFGAAHAESRGIILADTKFEFGITRRGRR